MTTSASVPAGACEPAIGNVLLSETQIHDRLAELTAEIDAEYADRDLVLLGVVKGAMMVVADLARLLKHAALKSTGSPYPATAITHPPQA